MEEILASIRRIIADEPANEPSRGPALRKEIPRNDVTRVESPLKDTRGEYPRPEPPSYEARASLHSTEWSELPTGRTQPFADPRSRPDPLTSETPDQEFDAVLAEPQSDSYEQSEAIEQPAQGIFETEQADATEYLAEAELSADEQVHTEEQEAETAEPHPSFEQDGMWIATAESPYAAPIARRRGKPVAKRARKASSPPLRRPRSIPHSIRLPRQCWYRMAARWKTWSGNYCGQC